MPTVPLLSSSTIAATAPYGVQLHSPFRRPPGSAAGPNGSSHSRESVLGPETTTDGKGVPGGYMDALPPDRQLFVLCDPVAFRWLEEETCTAVVHRNRTLTGYEVYLVEQWACSRIYPTFVISTYTGDPDHTVSVGVLNIPCDEASWSPRLRVYFKAVAKYHARPKETPYGKLMVTNLSSFRSALTVIPVPDGDVRRHREDFIVNEDLKRMGCLGRSALSLSTPADASQTKFHELYRTSDKIPFPNAVIELVRLCQIALILFEKLKPEHADGLLCDNTERGIYDWWVEFGTEFYNIEPSDGILGPTTVAALLGMVLGVKSRLSSFGAPVPKDAFDLPQLKKAIYHFQRQQRLTQTRRLDRKTMDALQRATMKSGSGTSSGDIFAVPRAIKSTVVDLGGRAVGSTSGKIEANSVETTDIEKFSKNLSGEWCKYLWRGKPRKSLSIGSGGAQTPPAAASGSRRNSLGGGSNSGDEGVTRDSIEFPNTAAGLAVANHPTNSSPGSNAGGSVTSHGPRESEGKDISDLRKAVFKTMSGRMKGMKDVASAGADYVRGRGHHGRPSVKDLGPFVDSFENFPSGVAPNKDTERNERETKVPIDHSATPPRTSFFTESPMGSVPNVNHSSVGRGGDSGGATAEHSAAGSIYKEARGGEEDDEGEEFVDSRMPNEDWATDFGDGRILECGRRRNRSFSDVWKANYEFRNEEFWPRRLSFSLAEEAILDTGLLPSLSEEGGGFSHHAPNLEALLADERVLEWTNRKITTVENLYAHLDSNFSELEGILRRQSETVNSMEGSMRDLIDRQKAGLKEAVREVEALGARLQYELGSVRGQIADVEDAVDGFGRNVEEVEERALGLGEAIERGWGEWLLAVVLGIKRRW